MAKRNPIISEPFITSAPKCQGEDTNGNPLYVGSTVEVPDALSNDDSWNHSFVGTIACFRGEYATVMDMDGDHFDIEPNRLELLDEC